MVRFSPFSRRQTIRPSVVHAALMSGCALVRFSRSVFCIHCFYHDTILTASTLKCCYGLLEFFKLLLRTLSCLVAHEHLQYIATDCSFYQTPTPTAAARNESKSGLIISIEKKKNGVFAIKACVILPLLMRRIFNVDFLENEMVGFYEN